MARVCFQPGVLQMLSLTKSDMCLTEGEPLGWGGGQRWEKSYDHIDLLRNYTLLEGNIIFYYSTQQTLAATRVLVAAFQNPLSLLAPCFSP